jgi:capsular exopolysaccharide synthesis family protein
MKESNELYKPSASQQNLARPIETVIPLLPPSGYGAQADVEDEFDVRKYWRAVRQRLWLIVLIVLLATLSAAIYLARKPDIYEARARVQVDIESGPTFANAKSGAIILNNPVNDPAYFSTQLQILTDGGLLRRVVKTLDLENNQAFFHPKLAQENSAWQNLFAMLGLASKNSGADPASEELPLVSSVAPATSRADLAQVKRLAPYVATVRAGLRVEPVKENRLAFKETRLIDVHFKHPDPQIAAKVTNAVVDTFVLSNLERKTDGNNTSSDFLKKRVAEVQAEIRNGEERLQNYARKNQILSLDLSQNTVVDRLVGLNKQLLEAENARVMAEAAYRAALAPNAASALAEDTATPVSSIEAKLADLKQQRAQLLTEYTEEWNEVKKVNEQINTLERQAQEMRRRASSNFITRLESRYKQALAHERALRTSFNSQRGQTLAQNEAAINYRIIQQEIDTNKNLLDGLLARSKENNVMLAGTTNNIHVIDYAIAPGGPIGPNRLQGVLFTLLVSLTFGVALTLFLGHLDNSIRTTDDVEKMLHLPTLATIPAAESPARRRLHPFFTALQLARAGDEADPRRALKPAPRISEYALAPLAEAFRQLRTSVLLSSAGGTAKTMLVTSSLPGEGKTTTTANLAMSLAQTGAKVLAIDADMRHPSLHSFFGLENERGLSTILSTEMSKSKVLSLIEQYNGSSLHVLTSGPMPPNPAELVGSELMRRLITFLESNFTYIIIDSPPIVSFTDGVLISSMVDGVLLVVHSGKSARETTQRSRKVLQEVGAKILGVVLNNAELPSQEYYAYQRYYGQPRLKSDSDSPDAGREP